MAGAGVLVLATVSVSVPCHVTNHVKVNRKYFNDHLVLCLFIYLSHCDDLHRLLSLDLLTATVRFDALNELNSFSNFQLLSFSSDIEQTYSLHDGAEEGESRDEI